MRRRSGNVDRWAAPIVIALAVVSAPSIAAACTCAGPRPDVATALAGSDLVVQARVAAHAFVPQIGFRTRLVITKTHKGIARRKLEVTAAKTCAVGFEVGRDYLVYANGNATDGWSTTYCTRTKPLADASDDLAEIARHSPSPSRVWRAADTWTIALASTMTRTLVELVRWIARSL